MSNIHDYIRWRGDLPICKHFPFNEIDNLIMARISYLIFDKIQLEPRESLLSISKKMKEFVNDDFLFNGDKELITLLGQSNRFKHIEVSDFIKNNNNQIEQQFSAITIHIAEDELYISYCGTDASIVGWKEDFNLAYMDSIPAQIEGIKYIEMIADKYTNTKFHVGGHSKGGNVSMYASIFAKKSVQDRIIDVTNFDGPGFDSNVIDSIPEKDFINKVITFIPQGSIIGRLMEHKGTINIVHSQARGIMQHDIYSWDVLKDVIIRDTKFSNHSELINETVCEWLKNTTPDNRKIFIDSIFEILYSTSATSFNGFTKVFIQKLPIIVKTYSNLSEEDRKVMIDMTKLFGKSYYDSLKNKSVRKNKKNNELRSENNE